MAKYEFLIASERHEADSLAGVSAIFSKARDAAFKSGAVFQSCALVRQIGYAMPFAYVSYNGRVWRGAPNGWASGDEPIFDPLPAKEKAA